MTIDPLRVLTVAISILLAGAPPTLADFADGLAAYDAGDYSEALAHWRPLAEAGEPDALLAIADLYSHGLGVPTDLARAAAWYRRAADQGVMIAQLNLGELYRQGLGVPRDLVAAYVWLSKAAGQGSHWAERQAHAVARELSPDQLAEAERRLAQD